MKVIYEHPPNIDDIDAAFHGVRDTSSILYTYGDAIYTTSKAEIPEWIHEHEKVHSQRQYEIGLKTKEADGRADISDEQCYLDGADWWWSLYLRDPEFRLEEELLAHRIELEVFSRFYTDRNTRRLYLKSIAKRLSSGMYGRMVSFEKAKRLIRQV